MGSAERKIRVLIVDDSVVIRRMLTKELSEHGDIEVVGSVANGAIALDRIPHCRPDVITLDLEMPVMDGMETLRSLRKLYPEIRVIMFSCLTERGASATIEALSSGADDYVAKTPQIGGVDSPVAAIRSDLLRKIRQFFVCREFNAPQPTLPPRPQPRYSGAAKKVVVIGVSTGGPNALAELLPRFPGDFPLPILIVQHMPPAFTRSLAERLNAMTELQVQEAYDGAAIASGEVLIAPGDYHMTLRRTGAGVSIKLNQDPHENSCRPSVDVMFRSSAETYGGAAIAVMLTGMGTDGLRGTAELHKSGAYVIAQDEASSVVWGMPGAVVNAGLADATVHLNDIAGEVLEHI